MVRRALAVTAVGLLALTACGGSGDSGGPGDPGGSGGSGGAAGAPPGSSAEPGPAEPGSGDQGADPQASELANIDPCTLLSADEAEGLGLPAQGDAEDLRDLVGTRGCNWTTDEESISVTLDLERSFEQLNLGETGTVTDVQYGTHTGSRVEAVIGPGSCSVFLDIDEQSSVEVQALTFGETAAACDRLAPVVRAVEPKLP